MPIIELRNRTRLPDRDRGGCANSIQSVRHSDSLVLMPLCRDYSNLASTRFELNIIGISG